MTTLFQPAHLVFVGLYVLILVGGCVGMALLFVLVVRRFGVEIHVTTRSTRSEQPGVSTPAKE